MKQILLLSILAALLGGCASSPSGYNDGRDGYYRDHNYSQNRGDYDRTDTYYHTEHGD